MIRIVISILIAVTWLDTHAQSSLPPCPDDTSVTWKYCFGTLTLTNGDEYVGEFLDGKFHGHGTYTFSDGGKHVGKFGTNLKSGQGALISKKGYLIAEGMWRENDVETTGGVWRLIGGGASTHWFVLTESIQQEGDFRLVWVMYADEQPVEKTGHISARSLLKFDCSKKREQRLDTTFFSRSFGAGDVLFRYQSEKWDYIAPGTIIESAMKYVCDYKLTPTK
jgi:hypothetical protein